MKILWEKHGKDFFYGNAEEETEVKSFKILIKPKETLILEYDLVLKKLDGGEKSE
jgi:hypothetical protein